eukprot:scaffold11839_cov124-Isochrysis_galbana.AAC.4
MVLALIYDQLGQNPAPAQYPVYVYKLCDSALVVGFIAFGLGLGCSAGSCAGPCGPAQGGSCAGSFGPCAAQGPALWG